MSNSENRQFFTRADLVELFQLLYELGGCGADEPYYQGWDAGVAACAAVVTELFGIDYDDLDALDEPMA